METFESVISRMPAGGEVRYFQYRHPAIRLHLGDLTPLTRDANLEPFMDLVVLIEEPLALDEEGGLIVGGEKQIAVGVVSYFSREFDSWLGDHDDSITKSWRPLCEPV